MEAYMKSLIDSMMETFCFVEPTKTPDGEGGFVKTWKDGAEFPAALVSDTTIEARIAEKQGVTSTFTVTTYRSNPLEYNAVIRRISDGATYRITSNGKDKTSPAVSTLDISQATAERWELT